MRGVEQGITVRRQLGMRAKQVRFPYKFTIAPNPQKKREKLEDQDIEMHYKDVAYNVQFLRMGLESLKVLKIERKRKIDEDCFQSVPLDPVPERVKKATAAYVENTIASKISLTSAS